MANGNIVDTIKSVLVPINREGYPFILIFAVVSLILSAFSDLLGSIGCILTVWCIYFFRDPERMVPEGDKLIISPADGKLLAPVDVIPPAELELGDEPLTRLSIFMNVFDVHVNRTPVAGTITASHYIPGKFLNASLDKASEDNERQLLKITTSDGTDFGVIQIAGLVARRIVCQVEVGQELKAGERIGLIRFGSRVDIFLPKGCAPLVTEGQTIIAGETVLAEIGRKGKARTAVKI